MTDQDLDRLLSAALQVDHSPGFVAGVRQRVEVEQMTAPWAARWTVAGAGAVAAAVIVAAILVRPEPERVLPAAPTQAPPVSQRAHRVPREVSPPTSAVGAGDVTPAPATGRRPARGRQGASAPEELRALRLFVDRAREGGVPAELPTDRHAVTEDQSLARIEIAPVTIEPVFKFEPFEEGDRQW